MSDNPIERMLEVSRTYNRQMYEAQRAVFDQLRELGVTDNPQMVPFDELDDREKHAWQLVVLSAQRPLILAARGVSDSARTRQARDAVDEAFKS